VMRMEWTETERVYTKIVGWDGDLEELKAFIEKRFTGLKWTVGCNDDEALHFEWMGQLFHVCFSDPDEVTIQYEVRCPQCGQLIPSSIFEEHTELLCPAVDG